MKDNAESYVTKDGRTIGPVVMEMKKLGIDDPNEVLSSAGFEFFERRYRS